MTLKKLIVFSLFCALLSSSLYGNDGTDGKELKKVLDNNKPFTMVVGDNVVLVEQFRVVPPTAEKETLPGEKKIAGVDQPVKVGNFWQQLKERFSFHGEHAKERTVEMKRFVFSLLYTLAVVLLLNAMLRRIIGRFFKGDKHHKTPLAESITRGLYWPLTIFVLAIGVRISFTELTFVYQPGLIAIKTTVVLAFVAFTWGIFRVIDAICKYYKYRNSNNNMNQLLFDLLRTVSKLLVGVTVILFVVQNVLGFNINTLLASAGVAGLAIAFAAQSTLANFFGSMMIIIDRPFIVGDRIKVNNTDGVVESVGFRSTRIRALDGNAFFIPNSQLADAVIENVSRRPNIKYAFTVGLVYATTPEQMHRAVALLHEILDRRPLFNMEEQPPRIYFTDMADWALQINVIVWFQTQDFFEAQEERQKINFEILRRFNAEGLEFAFPSHTTYLVDQTPDSGALSSRKS